MRIIDEFNIDDIKVTVFKVNEKISIKFEYNLLEQTYKFRDGSNIDNLEAVKKYCNPSTIKDIKSVFELMTRHRSESLQLFYESESDEKFDIII